MKKSVTLDRLGRPSLRESMQRRACRGRFQCPLPGALNMIRGSWRSLIFRLRRPSEVATGDRARLLSSWPAGDYSWPRIDYLEGWSAHDIYLLQDALLSDPAAFPSDRKSTRLNSS